MVFTFGSKLLYMLVDVQTFTTGKNNINYIISYISPYNPVIGIYGYSLGYFMLGGILANYIQENKIFTVTKLSFLTLFSMISLTLYGIIKSVLTASSYDIIWNGYDSIFTLIITISLFFILSQIHIPVKYHRLIILLGQNTLGIYFLHMILIYLIKPYFVQIFTMQNLLQNHLFSVLILFMSLILCVILKMIPIVKNLFLLS
jgi:surface polysaccharide O-acyltransferase-like enzyme